MTGDSGTDDGTAPPAVGRRTVLRATAGAVGAAGATGVAGGQEAPYGGWFTDATGGATDNYTGTVDLRGQSSVTVTVGADGNGGTFAFEPAAIRLDPGTTVTFDWVSDLHNVVVESQPDGAGWEGTAGAPEKTYDTGHTYEHTFETEGIYTYFCQPHLGLGMKGAVVVGDADVGESAGGDAAAGGRALPGGDLGALVVLGTIAAGAVGVLAVFGADAWASIRSEPAEEPGDPVPAAEREPVVPLGHDDFEPNGTLTLVLVYFLILLVMWVFTYFVEFLGRGPTVIG